MPGLLCQTAARVWLRGQQQYDNNHRAASRWQVPVRSCRLGGRWSSRLRQPFLVKKCHQSLANACANLPIPPQSRRWHGHEERNKPQRHLQIHPALTTCVISGNTLNTFQEMKSLEFNSARPSHVWAISHSDKVECLLELLKHFLRKHQNAGVVGLHLKLTRCQKRTR